MISEEMELSKDEMAEVVGAVSGYLVVAIEMKYIKRPAKCLEWKKDRYHWIKS